MEVVPALSDASPFQRRDVAEWTHRDRLTGVLEKARVETDRWAATTANSKHAYGKVVDSRDRSLPDGSAHQRQRQQVEVFQTKGPGGSLQVIRSQTVTSTNSSSSWRSGGVSNTTRAPLPAITQDFENLQLTLNPIDISSEKNKASVGRSGSIGARRPPSRPRSLVGKIQAPPIVSQDRPLSPAQPVVRICHQARDHSASSKPGGDQSPRSTARTSDQSLKGTARTGDQSAKTTAIKDGRDASASPSLKSSTVTLNGHPSISRKKSSSIEDLHNGLSEEREDSDGDGFKRSSKVRRSLQFPLKKLEARGGVCKLLQELEESSKRVTSDGRIARKSFEALENVLRRNITLASAEDKEDGDGHDKHEMNTDSEDFSPLSVNSISIDEFTRKFNNSRNKFMQEKRHSYVDATQNGDEGEKSPPSAGEGKNLSKRHSFVTVESLKEVRGRLKHLNSPLDGLDTESGMEELEDDGIGAEDTGTKLAVTTPQARVKSYVFGIEGTARPNRVPVLGTGSLESRTSNKASANGSRSDEWYNRRKSYGFESVHGDETHSRSSALISKFEDKTRLTSTDSGICRSSEQFVFPSWKRKQETDATKPSETEFLQVSHSIPLSKAIEDRVPMLDASKEDVRKGRTTVVTFGSKTEKAKGPFSNGKEVDSLHSNGEIERSQGPYLLNKTSNSCMNGSNRSSSQHVSVSVPVVQDDTSPSVVSRRLFFQQLSQGTSVSIEKPWRQPMSMGESQMPSLIGSRKIDADDWWRNSQILISGNSRDVSEDIKSNNKLSNGVLKRHSIAVDSSWNSFNNLNRSMHENMMVESASAVSNEPCYRPSHVSENESKRHSIAVDKLNYLQDDPPRADSENFGTRKQKRVEFCKTEVHFAAEPGRFNIVETDEKPPPTNMFRRRRRHSTPTPDPTGGKNLPVVRFGDSVYEKQLLGGTEDIEVSSLANGEPAPVLHVQPVRVHEEVYAEESFTETSHSLPINTMEEIEDHCIIESSLDPAPRSILKNCKKPKPYLIGENEGSYLEQKEEKWGVRLRPVAQQEQPAPWKTPSRDEVMPTEYSGQSELQKLLRSLRPAHPNRSRTAGPTTITRPHPPPSESSVLERVRHVEQVTSEARGFSTRVNFGAGEATVVDEDEPPSQRLYRANDQHKPMWQRREEAVAARDASKLKGTDYAMQIGQNCHVTSISRSLREKDIQDAEGGPPRGGTTTTITIDLSLPPCSNNVETISPNPGSFHVNSVSRISPHEVLQSPSLIMRTIHKPILKDRESVSSHARASSSVSSIEECMQICEANLEEVLHLKGPLEDCVSIKDRKTGQGLESTANGPLPHKLCSRVENGDSDDELGERESVEEVVTVNQLDAWRALYRDLDSELSDDDSERADEEVRSYMSGEGDGASSELSGSWSRATSLKNLRTTGYSTGNASADWLDESQPRPQPTLATAAPPSLDYNRPAESQPRLQQQRSVATAVLPSYVDNERLRAVETLVSTRSGQPKITSISLRYGEDDSEPPFRFTSKTAISAPPRGVSSTRLGHTPIEEVRPTPTDRKAFFDATSERSFSVRSSESPTRVVTFPHFDKKPFGQNRGNSPLPKPFPSCRIPPDALTITEVAPERSVTAKQVVHPESPLKTASIFDNELSPKSSLFSPSKSTIASQSAITRSHTALTSTTTVSPCERKASSSSTSHAGSQSPKPSRAIRQSGSEGMERTTSASHRSSPRPRRAIDARGGCVKLDTITATSRTMFGNSLAQATRTSITEGSKTSFGSTTQRAELKEDSVNAATALHIKESHETSQGLLEKTGRLSNGLLSPTVKSTLLGSELRKAVRSASKSPTPIKKVTPPSKNSKTKDFIGRVGSESPTYQNSSRKSASPSHTLLGSENSHSSRLQEQLPIYQNCDTPGDKYECGLDRVESDSAILAELTRAADEILQAVNGYTDDDSRRGSSDDDNRRPGNRRPAPLGTIDEAAPTSTLRTNGTSKRTQRVSSSKTKLGPTSSTSSVESFTRETRRALVKPERSGSRAARLVQRANSRELLLQTNASSSEDIASGTETKKQRAPPPRRSRTSAASGKDASASSSASKSREKQKESADGSRTRERTSSSRTKTRETSDARESRRKAPETKHHPMKEKTIPAASGLTGGRERSSHHAPRHNPTSTSTSTRTKKTSNVQEKTSSGAGKRRIEAAVQI